ncbi:MAG: HlyC/CorC family transporter [Candidatus Aegiribacteria sp.]|nr:HlyC/CorC family transporter [Candidatus Aegiribacteria sp.]
MTASIVILSAGFIALFISSGIRTCLPELILSKGRDPSERRQAAVSHLSTLWLIRFTSIISTGAGAVLMSIQTASVFSIPVWFSVLFLVVVIFLLGEILPSLIARANPDRFLLIFKLPYLLISFLFRLPSLLILGRPGNENPDYEDWLITPPDVIWLERRREKGYPGEYEKEQELMDSIIDFSDKIVREVMVPRIDMICVEIQSDLDTIIDEVRKAGHSRIPVYHEKIDDFAGVLYVKDLLALLSEGKQNFDLKDLLRKPYFVPEYKRIDELLREFQANRIHMAIVVDEYGGTAGLVTIEDIMEEVFGEILDEYDEETLLIKSLGDDSYLLDARLPIDDLNELLDTSFEDNAYESLGGMVYQVMGKIPRQGEIVIHSSFKFTVEKVRAQRILLVRIEPEGTSSPS